MNWRRLPWKRYDPGDFSDYLPQESESVREKLIAECNRRGVSVYVANSSEASSGAYANLRAVASEAELQSRLMQAIAVNTAMKANRIAWLAMIVALAGLALAALK